MFRSRRKRRKQGFRDELISPAVPVLPGGTLRFWLAVIDLNIVIRLASLMMIRLVGVRFASLFLLMIESGLGKPLVHLNYVLRIEKKI